LVFSHSSVQRREFENGDLLLKIGERRKIERKKKEIVIGDLRRRERKTSDTVLLDLSAAAAAEAKNRSRGKWAKQETF